MKNYSIMPLFENEADAICKDIERQYYEGVATEALMCMTLTPEGDPVVDKASMLCEKFDVIAKKLREKGKNAGVLVQATIGHGYRLSKRAPFQHVVSLINGNSLFRICPYDENFRKYIKDAFATIASHEPSSIMVDDDFRLFATSHRGCACPLHLKEISKRIGREITRDELFEELNKKTRDAKELMRVYYATQIDSLLGAARAMREGIDSVNPKLQGSFCICGDTAEGARDIAKILAGEGNPVIVRVNNGAYTPAGAKNLSYSSNRCAMQMSVMGSGVDVFLAETDTCPQNRHSTSASNLHAHFTASILEGAGGAKHWITKLDNYEPKSGEAYRKKLSKYSGFYEELSKTVRGVKWHGCRIPLVSADFIPTVPVSEYKHPSSINGWAGCVLERLGLPTYFSSEHGGAVCLDGEKDAFFSDDEIKKMLEGTVLLAVESAKNLISRGFGEYLGVKIEEIPATDTRASKEIIDGKSVSLQQKLHMLIPTSEKTLTRSIVASTPEGNQGNTTIPLFPAVTSYKNELGGTAIVFAGTPQAAFTYTEAFSFLVEPRKNQLIELLCETDNIPAYYPDDADVFLKAGELNDGALLCAFTNITLDIIENITLVAQKTPKAIYNLAPNGEWEAVSFTENGGVLNLDLAAETLHPVILKLI